MANIESIDILRLKPDDAERALPLSVEAGWNQVIADWRFMLGQGNAFGVADGERLVASALELPLGPALSWISMVLVTKQARRRGLGTRLLERCIEQAPHAAGLDATELGRPVYLPLGFRDLYRISRYRLEAAPQPAGDGVELTALTEAELPLAVSLDSECTSMRRGAMLADLRARMPQLGWLAWNGTRLAGYVLGRPGRLATQIGPVVADNAAVAIALTSKAMSEASPPFFVDACDAQTAYCRWLQSKGAVAPRFFIRMVRGLAPALGRAERIFAIAGPELG